LSPLPVTIITGFLGSGKTTLPNRLLSNPRLAETAVIVNEFGDIALDHLLVQEAIENTCVLVGGCICCSIRGVDPLMDLCQRASRGEIPYFSRVFIEMRRATKYCNLEHLLGVFPCPDTLSA
jgi:G3E family GTPase